MTQKLFLTSALAMGVIAPAMAEPSNTGSFPNDGYMQEDYTYTNAATEANMGVYEGTVNATAEYTDDLYNIVAGNYLEAGSEDENGTQCTAGNFCPGLTNALYNETTDQGLNSCSDATNGIYTLSAAGASSQNECYRECTTADVAHSRGTMNGGYYYGDNNQCEPTDCEHGWHLKAETLHDKYSLTPGSREQRYYSYFDNNGVLQFNHPANITASDFNLSGTEENVWGVEYVEGFGAINGLWRCSKSTQGLNDAWSENTSTAVDVIDEMDQSGKHYCWCKISEYKLTSDNIWVSANSSYWAFTEQLYNCKGDCPEECARLTAVNAGFREVMLSSVSVGLATCEANIININWYNADAADISANNAGTATYDSDIRTPVKAQTIKGKTFRGWRFSKPEQTNLP